MQSNMTYLPTRNRKLRQVFNKSKHAAKRCPQRAIDERLLPLVQAYGDRSFDGRGGVRYFMSRRALDEVLNVCGMTPELQRLQGVYMVLDSATETDVITVGHRH